MTFLKTHLFYVILIVVGLLAFRGWLQEHDARLASDQTVKVAEAKVADLQQQIVAVNAAAAKQVQVVVKQIEAVKTPAQAITAIPTLSDLPLNSRPAVDSPTAVTVDAIPLAQELAECRVTKINLDACTANLGNETAIVTQKQLQIVALQKPSFWKRVTGTLKTVGIGAAIGATLVLLR